MSPRLYSMFPTKVRDRFRIRVKFRLELRVRDRDRFRVKEKITAIFNIELCNLLYLRGVVWELEPAPFCVPLNRSIDCGVDLTNYTMMMSSWCNLMV